MKYAKGSHEKVSDHFLVSEFDCKCPQCTITLILPELIAKLEDIRVVIGIPLKINSGYRCEHYQEELRLQGFETAKGISTHSLGAAADISANGYTGAQLEAVASKAGFKSIGVGKSFVHVDLRDKERRWSYAKS